VLVLRDGSLLQLFIRLYEQVFGSSCMAAKLIVVISLCFVDPLPGRNDGLLCGPQIAVPVTDVYNWSLCKDRSAATKDQT
jgi:hypothetical protein